MLQDFQNITLRSLDTSQVLGALIVAFVCGFTISLVYRWTYRGSSYAPSFVRSMIFLSMITALVMLVIGNNLATGLAAGVGMHMVALISTVVICLAIVVTTKSNYAVIHKQSFLLQLSYNEPQHSDAASYLPILKQHCKRHKLINVRTVDRGEGLDLTFFVDLRQPDQREALTKELGKAPHVTNVNLYYDTEQF